MGDPFHCLLQQAGLQVGMAEAVAGAPWPQQQIHHLNPHQPRTDAQGHARAAQSQAATHRHLILAGGADQQFKQPRGKRGVSRQQHLQHLDPGRGGGS